MKILRHQCEMQSLSMFHGTAWQKKTLAFWFFNEKKAVNITVVSQDYDPHYHLLKFNSV